MTLDSAAPAAAPAPSVGPPLGWGGGQITVDHVSAGEYAHTTYTVAAPYDDSAVLAAACGGPCAPLTVTTWRAQGTAVAVEVAP